MKNLEETDYRYPMIEMDGIKRQFKMTEDLKITQGDVRQVQLAKGAILSGFYALLKKAGKEMSELDKVMNRRTIWSTSSGRQPHWNRNSSGRSER